MGHIGLGLNGSPKEAIEICGNSNIYQRYYTLLALITPYPNITAFHIIILLSVGAPLTPAGGSSCNLKKKNNQNDYMRGKHMIYDGHLVKIFSTYFYSADSVTLPHRN